MATRFYLAENVTAPTSPSPDAAWESSAAPFARRGMVTTTDAADTLTTTAGFASTAGQDRCHRQFVSRPLAAGLVFNTGITYKAYAQGLESAANDNIVARLGVRIVSRDGGTVRHTVLAVADYSTATEWNTALRNKAFANGDAGTGSYTTVVGDRLVVEFGHNDATGTSISASSRWGSGGSTDLGENETSTSTTERPWFETSLNLTFDVATLPVIWRPGDTLVGESFTRASTPVTYIDNIGTVIEVAGTNVKRSAAYLGGFGPGLLVESSRTNLTVGSEILDPTAGAWLASSVNWTANVATAPDLTLADRLTVSAAGHNIRNHHTSGFSPGNVMKWSCYVKNNGGTVAAHSIHDWTAGVDIVAVTSYFSQISDAEWRRLVLSFTVPAGCANFAIYPLRDSGTGVDLFSWGHQTEVGAFASSYTKTAGATSTRAADVYTVDIPIGVAATRYVKYYDLATAAIVESVSAITTGAVLTWDPDRLWLRHAVDVPGTKTLAEMRALYGDGKPRQNLTRQAVQRAANW